MHESIEGQDDAMQQQPLRCVGQARSSRGHLLAKALAIGGLIPCSFTTCESASEPVLTRQSPRLGKSQWR